MLSYREKQLLVLSATVAFGCTFCGPLRGTSDAGRKQCMRIPTPTKSELAKTFGHLLGAGTAGKQLKRRAMTSLTFCGLHLPRPRSAQAGTGTSRDPRKSRSAYF